MIKFCVDNMRPVIRKASLLCVCFLFLCHSVICLDRYSFAQEFRDLPQPGVMVGLSPVMASSVLQAVKVDPASPLRFEFLLDKGAVDVSEDQWKQESLRLIRYFLATLTIPGKDLWVNLSPYEKDRIIPEDFGLTEMGRDVLSQDYLLKQVMASVTHPEEGVGREFWTKVYAEAKRRYGTVDIPLDTFNKVWILPDKAVVSENGSMAFIMESRLKVMLEEDYQALRQNTAVLPEMNRFGGDILREIVIPVLTREVNEGKNFEYLRQVYHSLILGVWYKRKVAESLLSSVYIDRHKVRGIDLSDPSEKEKIYQRYVKAFKMGVYDYIGEGYDSDKQEIVPHRFFSGGVEFDDSAMAAALSIKEFSAEAAGRRFNGRSLLTVVADMRPVIPSVANSADAAQTVESQYKFRLQDRMGVAWIALGSVRQAVIAALGVDRVQEMLGAVGQNRQYFINFGLASLSRLFTADELSEWSGDITAAVQAVGGRTGDLLRQGLPAMRAVFGTEGDFRAHWDDIVAMIRSAGPGSADVLQGLRILRQKFNSKEEFQRYWPDIVAMVKGSGKNAGWMFVSGLPSVYDASKSWEDVGRYARGMQTVLSFMNEEQREFLFRLSIAAQIPFAVLDGSIGQEDRYRFLLSLLRLVKDEEKEEVVIRFLESYVFQYPGELRLEHVRSLCSMIPAAGIKYALYFMLSRRVSEDVRQWVRGYIEENGLFPLHKITADRIGSGAKKILVVQNIKDGQGDELIRMVPLVQGFLDYNPEITVTVVTARPYLYDHPRVKTVLFETVEGEGSQWDGFRSDYDVVVDHYDRHQVRNHDIEGVVLVIRCLAESVHLHTE
jgi:hypothetical protein